MRVAFSAPDDAAGRACDPRAMRSTTLTLWLLAIWILSFVGAVLWMASHLDSKAEAITAFGGALVFVEIGTIALAGAAIAITVDESRRAQVAMLERIAAAAEKRG